MMNQECIAQGLLSLDAEVKSFGVRPLLKWAGGKSQLIPHLEKAMPRAFNRYAELFVGGGAFFWHLALPGSVVADSNFELINFYEVVRDYPQELFQAATSLPVSKDAYYEIRAGVPACLSTIDRAARFVYLNKLCYNGLHRVNRRGEFNTPFCGKTDVQIIDLKKVRAASTLLKDSVLFCGDFEETARFLRRGDFVYLDPPYLPVGKFSDFKRYTKEFFSVNDHRRLAALFHDFAEVGVLALLSNAYHEDILSLYKGHYHLVVDASRQINCRPTGRGKISELLIANYEFDSSSIIS